MNHGPTLNSTGRGLPCTFGFATRGASSVRETAMNNPAKDKAARALIQRPQLILLPGDFDGGYFWSVPTGVDSSVVIEATFLSEKPTNPLRPPWRTIGPLGCRTHPGTPRSSR